MYLFISQQKSHVFELAGGTWLITRLVQPLHFITHLVCLEVLSPPASAAMTVGLEVRSLSKLPSSSRFLSVFTLSWCPHLSLFLSRSNPQRAPDWRAVQGWKAQQRGNPKANNTKIYMAGRGRRCSALIHTHTHTQTLRIITSTVLDTSGKTASVHIHIYATIKEQCVLRKAHFHFEKSECSCAHA